MAPPDKDVKIPCPTPQHLQAELDTLGDILALGEKEETWEKLERALIRFAGVTRGGGYKHVAMYVEGIGRKGVGHAITACMTSDRGRLSSVAIDLLQTLAPRLALNFAPLVPLYLDPIIRLLGRPNKVVLKRTDKCLSTMISRCHLPAILYELKRGLNDDAATCRRGCSVAFERALKEWPTEVLHEKALVCLEESVKRMAKDKDLEVRQTGKRVWASFMGSWSERVESFSAPLTPTVRKNLDIAAPDGPSKAKPIARPVTTTTSRPISVASSSSSTSAPPRKDKAQHPRVNAFASRPARAVPDAPVENGHRRVESITSAPVSKPDSPSRNALSKSTASRPFEPPKMPHIGRSVSHMNFSTTAPIHSGPPSPNGPPKHDVWSKPQRPHLPTSYSTASLPADTAELTHAQPHRRFPPPARVVRPAPIPSTREGGVEGLDNLFTSGPSVLRGPVRLPQAGGVCERWVPSGPTRMGPAPKRVVTAPLSTPTSIGDAGIKTVSRSVKKRVELLEGGIRATSQPPSPVPSKAQYLHLSPPPLKTALPVASPLLPVLARSSNSTSTSEHDLSNENLLDVEPEHGANITILDTTIVQDSPESSGQGGDQTVVPETKESEMEAHVAASDRPTDTEKQEGSNVLSGLRCVMELAPEPTQISEMEATSEPREAIEIPLPPSPVLDRLTLPASSIDSSHQVSSDNVEIKEKDNEVKRDTKSEPSVQVDTEASEIKMDIKGKGKMKAEVVVVETKERPAPVKDVERQPVKGKQPIKVLQPKPHVEAPKPVEKKAAPPPRKAALPPRVPRAPGGIDRRPFKPTSHTASAAMSKRTTTLAGGSSKPVTAKTTMTVSASSSTIASVATSLKASTSAPPPKPPVPRANEVDRKMKTDVSQPQPAAKSCTAPPVAAQATIRPAVKPAHAAPTVPPVRRERVRLKPPVPSFVPTRGKARAVAGYKALSTSTSMASIASSTNTTQSRVKTGMARVKPETIPLPMSPAEKATLPPAAIPLPRSPMAGGMADTPSKPSPSKMGTRSVSTAASPVMIASVKPLPPVLDASPARALPTPSSSKYELGEVGSPFEIPSPFLNANGLPIDPDHFPSTASRYASSKASTVPAIADDTDSESNDLEGVSTKLGQPARTRKIQANPLAHDHTLDLMEFSAPSRPAQGQRKDVAVAPSDSAGALLAKLAAAGSTPKSTRMNTGEREALSVRDANVREDETSLILVAKEE